MRRDIATRYGRLGEDVPVAVRSSALGEDSAEATFAGQQDTYLWVRGVDAICDAVTKCWASLYSTEAVSYRERFGVENPAMGVTIQLMVDAAVSGVMFTCNPVSGDRSMVAINASWGLGLAVVGGEVTPDDYLVSKVTGEVVKQTINDKAVEYVPAANGTKRVDVDEDRRTSPASMRTHSPTLVKVAKRIEKHFGAPQDIEWAFDDDRRVVRPPIPPGHRPGQERADARPRHIRHVHDLQQVRSPRLMPLTDDDVREILRIIDESELDELSIETEGFSLHVRKGSRAPGGRCTVRD